MLTTILSFWAIGILLVEYALSKTKAVRNVDEARDSKFPAFRRTDVHLWSRPRLYLGSFMILPKFMMALIVTFTYFLFAKVVMIGCNLDVGLVGIRKALISFGG
jgi:hypothetical protein